MTGDLPTTLPVLRREWDSVHLIGEQLAAVLWGRLLPLLDRVSGGVLCGGFDRLAAVMAEGQNRIARGDYQ